jgi:long-chain fatty acid transport protein
LGASGSLVVNHVSTVRARNADGSDDITNADGSLKEGRALLEATGLTPAFSAGLYWEADDARRLRFGLAYQSQPGLGQTRMSGHVVQQFGADPNRAAEDKADFLVDYPDAVRFGVAGRITEQWELRSDVEYVRWSTFKRQCVVKPGASCSVDANGLDTTGNVILNVPRDFQDTVSARVGGAYFPADNAQLFGSLGFSTSAVPKRLEDVAAIDAFSVYVSAGGRYHFSPQWALAVNAIYLWMADVDTNGASAFYTYQGASRSPSENGKYASSAFLLNSNVQFAF